MAGRLPPADPASYSGLTFKSGQKIAIIVSDWNKEITSKLLLSCTGVFRKAGYREHLVIVHVPGAFEIPLTVSRLLKRKKCIGAVALGCVIQGETKHDDYLNHSITKTLLEISVLRDKPVINGVLTTNNMKQALERSGGKYGNKGEECAASLLRMLTTFQMIDTL